MKPISIQIAQQESMYKSKLDSISAEWFQIPSQFHNFLASYYKLHWTPKHFISAMYQGTIFRDLLSYHVEFQGCNLGQILALKDIEEPIIMLSFRLFKPQLNILPRVIVQIKRNQGN